MGVCQERHWSVLEERLKNDLYPAVVEDPYFNVNQKGLLQRYLVWAEQTKHSLHESFIMTSFFRLCAFLELQECYTLQKNLTKR